MIPIAKTKNADTRTADKDVTKQELLKDTLKHISAVQRIATYISNMLIQQTKNHDHTKLEYLDLFYKDFIERMDNGTFKDGEWWKIHRKERHHLDENTPEDVNLIDVIEFIIDGCCAGTARSGVYEHREINNEILQNAVKNTEKLILNQIIISK